MLKQYKNHFERKNCVCKHFDKNPFVNEIY